MFFVYSENGTTNHNMSNIIHIVRRVFDFNPCVQTTEIYVLRTQIKSARRNRYNGSRKRIKLPKRAYSCCNFNCLPIIFYMIDNVIILISHISYPVTYLGFFHGGEVRGRDIKILVDIFILLL